MHTMHEREFRKLVGHVIAERYQLEHVISSKENRAVFRANDLRLGRAVAVKVGLGSMTREARNFGFLPHHPNVTPAYDYGTDGVLRLDYIVLELLDGVTLASALAHAGRRMGVLEAAWILKEISAGLGVLHRTGIVHCDLNPSHVFLVAYQRKGDVEDSCVRLLGLGRSQTLQEDDEPTPLPRERDYLAPEQRSGTPVTPATDIYSCGLIGLELVGGSPRRVNSAGEAAVERELERVSRFRPEVAEWFVRVLGRCLRNDQGHRYAEASELMESMEQRNADLYPARTLEAAAMPPSWADIFELRPNLWGIGLDLKAAWRKLMWHRE
jgi:serine/threonine protein kinase